MINCYREWYCTHYQQVYNLCAVQLHTWDMDYYPVGLITVYCNGALGLTRVSSMFHALSSLVSEDSLKFFDKTKQLCTTC